MGEHDNRPTVENPRHLHNRRWPLGLMAAITALAAAALGPRLWAGGSAAPTLQAVGGAMSVAAGAVLGDGGGGDIQWVNGDPETVAGAARRWEASLPAGPYGQVNLRTGRMLTTLPVVGWSGRGPAISFSLYHSMGTVWGPPDYFINENIGPGPPGPLGLVLGDANEDGQVNDDDIVPFIDIMLDPTPTEDQVQHCDFDGNAAVDGTDLDGLLDLLEWGVACPLWTHSYSRHLLFDELSGNITLVWDDGTRDVFEPNGQGGYVSPPGLFVTLAPEYTGETLDGYMLTTKSQEKMRFQLDGKLDYLEDANGNRVEFDYVAAGEAQGALEYVTDTSGRVLQLSYDAMTGHLIGITDPINRTWKLLYEDGENEPSQQGAGPFVILADPMDKPVEQALHRIKWTYTDDWSIGTLYDKAGSAAEVPYFHAFTYLNGRLKTITDPAPLNNQTQQFAYGFTNLGNFLNTYTDRRGNDWTIKFAGSGNLLWWTDPLDHKQQFAYAYAGTARVHERTGYTNALNKTWTATYDANGNVLTTTDPLGNTWTFGYDENYTITLNNLTSVTPPGDQPGPGNTDKMVQYTYDINGPFPTSVTTIILPADGQGNDATTIDLVYYIGGEAPEAWGVDAWKGLLKTVTDANDVGTLFEYDRGGQLWRRTEGDPSNWSQLNNVFDAVGLDKVGRVVGYIAGFSGCYPGTCETERRCAAGACPAQDECGCSGSIHCCCRDLEDWYQVGMPSRRGEGGCGEGEEERGDVWDWGFVCTFYGVGTGERNGSSSWEYNLSERKFTATAGFTDGSVYDPKPYLEIEHQEAYDVLRRPIWRTLNNDEIAWGTPLGEAQAERRYDFVYNDADGIYERIGPDDQTTRVTLDVAGRVWKVERGPDLEDPESPKLSVEYAYYADDRVWTATYGNGTRAVYEYDDAGRVTLIRHEQVGSDLLIELAYEYTPDGLIQTVAEVGPGESCAMATYTYDNRNRLVEEERVGDAAYHLSYTYDQGGNRKTKVDHAAQLRTEYFYDFEPDTCPDMWGCQSWNNRLMHYVVYDVSGQEPVPTEEFFYEYNTGLTASGHPSLVVRKEYNGEGGRDWYHAVDLQYNNSGELWFVTQRHWPVDDVHCWYEVRDRITEFRGSGRARYMVRQRRTDYEGYVKPGTTRWTDYDGDEIYGDYVVVVQGQSAHITNTMSYLPGVGQMDPQTGEVTYYHGDHLGTLRLLSDQQSAVSGTMVYTAFGEVVCGDESHPCGTGVPPVGTRYQYAGEWGYEAGLLPQIPKDPGAPIPGLPWQHVGHRWYDASSGRFLQRDPIGVRGALNVYMYVGNGPYAAVDAWGLSATGDWLQDWGENIALGGGVIGGGMFLYSCASLGPTAGASAPLGIGGGVVAAVGGVVGGGMVIAGKIVNYVTAPDAPAPQPPPPPAPPPPLDPRFNHWCDVCCTNSASPHLHNRP